MDIAADRKFLKTSEASELLRARFGIERTEKTLSRYRSIGVGPAYLKRPDGSVFYFEMDLVDWGQSLLAGTERICPRLRELDIFEG